MLMRVCGNPDLVDGCLWVRATGGGKDSSGDSDRRNPNHNGDDADADFASN